MEIRNHLDSEPVDRRTPTFDAQINPATIHDAGEFKLPFMNGKSKDQVLCKPTFNSHE